MISLLGFDKSGDNPTSIPGPSRSQNLWRVLASEKWQIHCPGIEVGDNRIIPHMLRHKNLYKLLQTLDSYKSVDTGV